MSQSKLSIRVSTELILIPILLIISIISILIPIIFTPKLKESHFYHLKQTSNTNISFSTYYGGTDEDLESFDLDTDDNVDETCFEVLESGLTRFYAKAVVASGNLLICLFIAMILLSMKTGYNWLQKTSFGERNLDCTDFKLRRSVNVYVAEIFLVVVLFHMLVFFGPVVGDDMKIRLISGSFTLPISSSIDLKKERGLCNQLGEKTVAFLTFDDMYRIVEFPFIFVVLLKASLLMMSKPSFKVAEIGKCLMVLFATVLFIEMFRRHDHEKVWIYCSPFVVLLIVEKLFSKEYNKDVVAAKMQMISDSYMLVYWLERTERVEPIDFIGQQFEVKIDEKYYPHDIRKSALVQKKLEFTTFSNNSLLLNRVVNKLDEDIEKTILSTDRGLLELNKQKLPDVRRSQKVKRLKSLKQLKASQTVEAAIGHNYSSQSTLTYSLLDMSGKVSRLITFLNETFLKPEQRRKGSIADDSIELEKPVTDDERQMSEREIDLEIEALQQAGLNVEDEFFETNEPRFTHGFLCKVDYKPSKLSVRKRTSFVSNFDASESFILGQHANKFKEINERALKVTTWQTMEHSAIQDALVAKKDVILVSTGTGAVVFLDSLRFVIAHSLFNVRFHLLYSTPDVKLMQWLANVVDEVFHISPHVVKNVKVILALTAGQFATHNILDISAGNSEFFDMELVGNYRSQRTVDNDVERPDQIERVTSSKRFGLFGSNQSEMQLPLYDKRSNLRSNKRKAIRFDWGKVVLGRINVFEKFKKLYNLEYDGCTFYEGDSLEMLSLVKECSKFCKFKFTGPSCETAIKLNYERDTAPTVITSKTKPIHAAKDVKRVAGNSMERLSLRVPVGEDESFESGKNKKVTLLDVKSSNMNDTTFSI